MGLKITLDTSSDVSISINNILGQTLVQEEIHAKDVYREFDVDHLSTGIYLVEIIINDEIAPVLPSSKVVTRALGISATIPENIINEIPLPIPL